MHGYNSTNPIIMMLLCFFRPGKLFSSFYFVCRHTILKIILPYASLGKDFVCLLVLQSLRDCCCCWQKQIDSHVTKPPPTSFQHTWLFLDDRGGTWPGLIISWTTNHLMARLSNYLIILSCCWLGICCLL